MRARVGVVGLVLGLVTSLMGPAMATTADPCVDPETKQLKLTTQPTWIHQAAHKAGNLAALGQDAYPSWNTTKPTQSVQAGAGGGYAGNMALVFNGGDDATLGATFVGEFDGCLDTMLVELYAFLPTNRTSTNGSLAEQELIAYITLTVGGVDLVYRSEVQTRTVANPTGTATYRIRFAFKDLHAAMVGEGLATSGKRSIRLNVTPRFVNTGNALFVYDTTEVPAGIVFNGAPDLTYASAGIG